ncbi:hypothetical protein HYV10_04040 [Candidatus Dependentiae bacterium]|nr:hypothetical protein [Candidatus Dependentiae bacterium]
MKKYILTIMIFLSSWVIRSMDKRVTFKMRPFVLKSTGYQAPSTGFLRPTVNKLSISRKVNKAYEHNLKLAKYWTLNQLLKKGPSAYIFMDTNLKKLDNNLQNISERLYPFFYGNKNIQDFWEYKFEKEREKKIENIESIFKVEAAAVVSRIVLKLEKDHPLLFQMLILEIMRDPSNLFQKIFTDDFNSELIDAIIINLSDVFGNDSAAFKLSLGVIRVKDSLGMIKDIFVTPKMNGAVDPFAELRKIIKYEILRAETNLILKIEPRNSPLFAPILKEIKNMSVLEEYNFFISVIEEIKELIKKPFKESRKIAINSILNRTFEQTQALESFQKNMDKVKIFVAAVIFLGFSEISFGLVNQLSSLANPA